MVTLEELQRSIAHMGKRNLHVWKKITTAQHPENAIHTVKYSGRKIIPCGHCGPEGTIKTTGVSGKMDEVNHASSNLF